MLYSNRTPADIAYQALFDEAKSKLNFKIVYTVNESTINPKNIPVYNGFINADLIVKEVPDYKERMFYISGPRAMIVAFEDSLSKLGIPKANIKTDFFPGFV
jgi:ferredoxin-NADP reductase